VFATSNCARLGELRRGIDHALIFSIAISPDNRLLAVTSDKSTLHIFDLPHPARPPGGELTGGKPHNPANNGASPVSEEPPRQKWGFLGKIPMLPRVFSDVYSLASAHFEIGDDQVPSPGMSYGATYNALFDPTGRPAKGVIGWRNAQTVLVVGAGQDGRWERFVLGTGDNGKMICVRSGWKRYLGS
jgi:WD repeat-containing protein 45